MVVIKNFQNRNNSPPSITSLPSNIKRRIANGLPIGNVGSLRAAHSSFSGSIQPTNIVINPDALRRFLRTINPTISTRVLRIIGSGARSALNSPAKLKRIFNQLTIEEKIKIFQTFLIIVLMLAGKNIMTSSLHRRGMMTYPNQWGGQFKHGEL